MCWSETIWETLLISTVLLTFSMRSRHSPLSTQSMSAHSNPSLNTKENGSITLRLNNQRIDYIPNATRLN